ncbi:MAG TPA: PAS domain-containing protein [Candidatus Baltobacteraceae bacterium]|nr:PAS domain-containing protein [Candidatus Baltobacteraceae bacterium]
MADTTLLALGVRGTIQLARLLDFAMDQANDGIAIMKFTDDPETPIRIVYANRSIERISGFTREELLDPDNPFLRSQPQNRERYAALLQKVRSGEEVRFEIELTGKDRSTWAEIRWSPLRYSDDDVTHYVAVLRDITTEEQLDLLQAVLSRTSDFVLTTDAVRPSEGGPAITFANPAFSALVGLTHEEIVGASLTSFFSPANNARIIDQINSRLERHQDLSHELRLHRSGDDRHPWIELSGHTVRDERGSVKSWVFIGKDIGVRKQGYIQTAQLMRALDLADEPIAIYHVNGLLDVKLEHANERAAKLGEPLLEKLLREPWQRERIAGIWRTLEAGNIVRRLVRVVEEDSLRWVTLVLQPIKDLRSISSLVAIQHYVGSAMRESDVQTMLALAREILSYSTRAARRDAVLEVLREEWGAFAFIHRTEQNTDVVLRPAERTGEAVMPAGVLFAHKAVVQLWWREAMVPQKLTALRVFLETLGQPE